MNTSFKLIIFDNGSYRPSATFALRNLAYELSKIVSTDVEPISLLHSSKIDPVLIGGKPASIIRRRFKEAIKRGEKHLLCIPLFLGPSLAISEYLVTLIEEAKALDPEIDIRVAPPLAGSDFQKPDPRLAQILADQIEALMKKYTLKDFDVVLVDHGSPIKKLSELRNNVAEQLGELLHTKALKVHPCSMERRHGAEYAFNEPLLGNVGQMPYQIKGRDLVVAMFFILPGRHAGEGGDVDGILQELKDGGAIQAFYKTDLLGNHPMLLEILKDRIEEGLNGLSKT